MQRPTHLRWWPQADLVSVIAWGLPRGGVIDSRMMERDIIPHMLSMDCVLGRRHLARARAEVLAARARGYKVEGQDGVLYSLDVDLHSMLECVLEDCCECPLVGVGCPTRDVANAWLQAAGVPHPVSGGAPRLCASVRRGRSSGGGQVAPYVAMRQC
jgi:hypothetical protein